MNFKTLIQMMMITAGVMFACNMVAAMSPGARRLFKGSVVVPVNAVPTNGRSIAV